uniref:Uncharacterized protein n=1 Tax=Panagrolaimus davidi TaxID=227884 RepID=A0A914QUK8_9BILA
MCHKRNKSNSITKSCIISINTSKCRKCTVQNQYNIFDKIINKCSDETFKKLNITFSPAKPVTTTYIDDLNELGAKKVGPISDSAVSKENLEIFGNLTYDELDALKITATISPYLKQYICDPKDDTTNFQFVQMFIATSATVDAPQIPEKIKNLSKTFTQDTYDAVKAVLKVQPHFRWLICSSIFAISDSKEMSTAYSSPNFLFFG